MNIPLLLNRSFRRSLLLACALPLLALGALTAGAETGAQAEAGLKKADADLNAVYQEILSGIKDSTAKENLVKAQREWITFRDTETNAEAAVIKAAGAGSKYDVTEAKTALTTERVQALQRLKGSL